MSYLGSVPERHDRNSRPPRLGDEVEDLGAGAVPGGGHGQQVASGGGTSLRVALGGVRAVFHRPHPQRETDRGALRSVRRFLQEAGHHPD